MSRHYFDYAAATPPDPKVVKLVAGLMSDRFANPGSPHSAGRESREQLEQARKQVAKVLGAKPAEIVFTSGSTEAISMAISGVMQQYPNARLAVSAIEHEAVLAAAEQAEAGGAQVGVIAVGPSGVVQLDQVQAAIDDSTVLLAVQYANNEIGSIQPITQIGQLLAQIRRSRQERGVTRPLYFFCDGAQAGLLSLGVARLGVDLLSMGATKLYGPPGVGFLYIRTGTELVAVTPGGGQEQRRRGGTPSAALAAGLALALEQTQAGRVREASRQQRLRDELWKELKHALADAELNGELKSRLPGNLNLNIPGADGETLVAHLDKVGFMVATGAACSASNQEPSHVLLAIGRSVPQARSSLRISLGEPTTSAEVKVLATAIKKVAPRVKQLSKEH